MGAVSRARDLWQRTKLRLWSLRKLGRWNVGSPVIATGTNAEILPYEALEERRFEKLKAAAGARLSSFQTDQPQYPTASSRRLTLQGFRKNSIARRCIELLCESATMAQPVVQNLDGSEGTSADAEKIREFLAFPSGREQSGPRGSVGPLLWWDVYWRLIQDLYYAGNGMLEWVDGVGTADPVQMWRMPPERTWVAPDAQAGIQLGAWIDHYVVEVDGIPFKVPRERVIHTRFWDPLDEFLGVPPLWSALRDLASDNSQTDFQKITVQNMGVPPAVIEYDLKELRESHMRLDPHKNPTDRAAMESMRDRLSEMYGGRHRGKMGIAYGFKVKLLGLDMRALDHSALVRISESRIATAHGVPMTLMNRSSPEPDRPGAATRQMKEHFFTGTVTALVNRIESILSPRIVAAFDPLMRLRIKFDMSGVDVIREQRLKRGREAGAVFQTGLANRGICQQMAGIPLHGDGDEFVPLSAATAPDRMQGDQGEGVGP